MPGPLFQPLIENGYGMNRYPLWKYITVLVALIIGILYTAPNFFGETPAVQVSSAKVTQKVTTQTMGQVEDILRQNNIAFSGTYFQQNGPAGTVRVRLANTDAQLKARDVLDNALNPVKDDPSYTVALNLLSASPDWMSAIGANPMYLGLDLRGGVHFLLQVDMQGALAARYESLTTDIRSILRDARVAVESVNNADSRITATFASEQDRNRAQDVLRTRTNELSFTTSQSGDKFLLNGTILAAEIARVQDTALKQNILTLHNRINELGVAEPIIQQQGLDRIIVQLPGIQDVAKAKEILGRTATLQLRMVDDSPAAQNAMATGTVPFGLESFKDTDGRTVLVRRQVLLTGENLENAQSGATSKLSNLRSTSRWTTRARVFSVIPPATISANAWPSFCLRMARARS